MNTYIISYDLRKNKDYKDLILAIKNYSHRGKVLESLWVIKSASSALEISNHLLSKIDGDDGLFVVQSAHVGAWFGVLCSDDRLKENL